MSEINDSQSQVKCSQDQLDCTTLLKDIYIYTYIGNHVLHHALAAAQHLHVSADGHIPLISLLDRGKVYVICTTTLGHTDGNSIVASNLLGTRHAIHQLDVAHRVGCAAVAFLAFLVGAIGVCVCVCVCVCVIDK